MMSAGNRKSGRCVPDNSKQSLIKPRTAHVDSAMHSANSPSVSISKEGFNATSGSRRASANKDSLKTEKLLDRNRSSYKPATSVGSRMSNSLRKSKEGIKSKSELDKSNLETKIRDLMALAKTKDSEIRSLKLKLDQMMLLLDQRDDCGASPKSQLNEVEKSSGNEKANLENVNELQKEVSKLLSENLKLKQDLELISTANPNKPYQNTGTLPFDTVPPPLSNIQEKDNPGAALMDNITNTGSASASSNETDDSSSDKTADDCVSDASSVTVACLTERIQQMEENHISTHEELEATVQELNDLQKSIPELTIDNKRLQQEKGVLELKVEKLGKRLSQQTNEINHLRVLVSDRFGDGSNSTDLQQQYLLLFDEREELLQYQESLNKEVQHATEEKKESEELAYALQERMRHLEQELTQANKSLLDKKMKNKKESSGSDQVMALHVVEEELRLERRKNEELFKTSNISDNVTDLIDSLQIDNRNLSEKCALVEEDARRYQQECEKMDARIAHLEEEQEATSAKSKHDLSELSELIDKLQEDLRMKQASLDEASETLFVMEDSVEQHMAVKKHDNHIIHQLQNQVSSLKEERFRLEKEIQQLRKEQRNQSEEWKQFQNDLQMAVMIANDMKAETQSEVSRLREENQLLDEQNTKLRVENEQLRRKRVSSVSGNATAILEAASLRQSNSTDLVALRDNYNRRSNDNSPGVQGLIKSFNKQTNSSDSPARSQSILASDTSPAYKVRSSQSPVTAAVSPIPRHHSIAVINTSPSSSNIVSTDGGGSSSATPEVNRTNSSDLTQLSSLLRHNSGTQESRKNESKQQPHTDMLERRNTTPATQFPTQMLSHSKPSSDDPLASLARHYGGSKRNALLQWCQAKTKSYPGVDITNFSSSWSDGLALCALLHSYLPAHIPYETLRQNYDNAADDASRQQLQAKNFRLAFAAAESVGIEPTLTKEEMTTKERPDWQRVMAYVTQVYKYFET